eukprot:CAMPEP_0175074664 /NCGR_PEP_ID=MMETSP0052_2-20121109/21458_1 /TAXON_ID=51329 ORGANISM="Polytomella parva, Strain SAG 63-3" /NCGR_SAMPLE_ID=MMETSP0052_2 /ASSEMBLY_ACC=CAM_ASM_000194 /LENGTH=587 /DNA_ID=CAMNT_0016343039 /DNA_START=164 /DNA_END=1927 /DNA_ORIENTATION=+
MTDNNKIQALKHKIEEVEAEATVERSRAAMRLEELKQLYEEKILKERELLEKNLGSLEEECSYLKRENKLLQQRHTLLLDAFKNVRNETFEEYISIVANKAAQSQIKAICEEAEARAKVLQKQCKELQEKNASLEEIMIAFKDTVSAKQEEIGDLEDCVNTLNVDIKKSSTKIRNLEAEKDEISKELKKSKESWSSYKNEVKKAQSRYDNETEDLINKLDDLEQKHKELKGDLEKAKEREAAQQRIMQERVSRSVQPHGNQEEGSSSVVFSPLPLMESVQKLRVKAGGCGSRYGLDINSHNVMAVVHDYYSVYLYSEETTVEEKLCTCSYVINCLVWNKEGDLLAIGGRHNNDIDHIIQVWDIPTRRITKRFQITNKNQHCHCLVWNDSSITAGTVDSIYQWNVKNLGEDQDIEEGRAVLLKVLKQNENDNYISSMQWSTCKSRLAMITRHGDMYIYDEKLKMISKIRAHADYYDALLQWCSWDNQVIATCCKEGYLKIWRVTNKIELINKIWHESAFFNIKWMPSKQAIISAHKDKKLILWEGSNLTNIGTVKSHTGTPDILALNGDESSIVSKSGKEIIFWKSFD